MRRWIGAKASSSQRVICPKLKRPALLPRTWLRRVLPLLPSGDGRIVITAAKEFGARGVGVDIDPALIREARENALKAGVADKVKFLQQDLFETDIREATVVTLYLLPEVNRRLRPKLLSDLKPGTRVVSHNHDMGDWTPLKTLNVRLLEEHRIYYWWCRRRTSR